MDCCRYVNPFRACAGLRGLGYLMVAIVAAVVAVSYYAVVVYAWGPMLLGGGAEAVGAAAVLAGFHVLVGNDGLVPLSFFSLQDLFFDTA
jgi:palmitoyltransferase ZDHHC2/15/20